VVAPPFVFVSGQLGLDPATGELVGDDLESQSRQALENLRQILTTAGSGLEQVTAVEVFLTDMGRFADFNAIYAKYFSARPPARAVIEVSALPKGGCVEIKCTAVVGEQ
jgi:2-iminobutanoate/2-iminopropanoate deaminase